MVVAAAAAEAVAAVAAVVVGKVPSHSTTGGVILRLGTLPFLGERSFAAPPQPARYPVSYCS